VTGVTETPDLYQSRLRYGTSQGNLQTIMGESIKDKTSKAYLPFLGIQHNVVQHYRLPLFRLLKQRFHGKFALFADQTGFSSQHRGTPDAQDIITPLHNTPLLGGRFLWQSGCFRQRLRAELLVVSFNLRILSNYPILMLRWLLRRPTLLWGHVTGRSSLTTRFGFLQLIFAKGLLCYTETQSELFRRLHPHLKIPTFVAANSCVYQADCYAIERSIDEIRDIIFVGRLVKEKKPDLLLQAFLLAKEQKLIPSTTRLVFVGRGPEDESLRRQASASQYADNILFLGHIAEVDRLRQIYSTAFCSVSPGYIGLSIIQSFALGVPVLAARDEPHSPKVEVCHKIDCGCFFPSDSVTDLANALSDSWNNRGWENGRLPQSGSAIMPAGSNWCSSLHTAQNSTRTSISTTTSSRPSLLKDLPATVTTSKSDSGNACFISNLTRPGSFHSFNIPMPNMPHDVYTISLAD
jgi:glycosyltransferase involved in cell wall biosynthesis